MRRDAEDEDRRRLAHVPILMLHPGGHEETVPGMHLEPGLAVLLGNKDIEGAGKKIETFITIMTLKRGGAARHDRAAPDGQMLRRSIEPGESALILAVELPQEIGIAHHLHCRRL